MKIWAMLYLVLLTLWLDCQLLFGCVLECLHSTMATEEIRNRGNNYSRANTLPCIQAAAKGGLLWLHFHHWLNMPFWAVILKYLFPATTATPAPCQPGTHLALPSSDPQELCNWDFHIIRAREYRRRRNILTKNSLK